MRSNATLKKLEMISHADRWVAGLWWHLMPGDSVSLPWPNGWTESDHLGNQVFSADPNDHWRPWLEANAGRQGWDWDWRLGSGSTGHNSVEVRFRRGRQEAMMAFAMRWA